MKPFPETSNLPFLPQTRTLIALASLMLVVYLVSPYTVMGKSLAYNHHISSTVPFAPDAKDNAKAVVEMLVAEDYEGIRRHFNATMRAGLSAEKMKEVWRAAIEHHGAVQSQGEPRLTTQQGWERVFIRCEMERGAIEVEVGYDPEGKIGGLWVRPTR